MLSEGVLRAHHQGAGHRLAVGADELALERPAAVEPDVDRDRLFPRPGIDLDEGVEVRRHRSRRVAQGPVRAPASSAP